MVVRAEGQRIVLDPELRTALAGQITSDGLTPRAAAAALVAELVTQHGGEVRISDPEEPVLVFGAEMRTG
jgi:histidine phosphotransferase ChpT